MLPQLARPGIALAAVVALAGVVAAVATDDHPARWDERVRPLAEFVERARGGPFEHPVEVRFLTAEEYADATRVDAAELDEDALRALADETALFRAVGLLEGDPDILGAVNDVRDTGTLAFYNPVDEVVVVRGTELTPDVGVTLVHELVHVWQDQHHDIDELYVNAGDEATAVRGLLEGDAIRIEQEYVFTRLSTSQQEEYFATADAGVDQVEEQLAGVPSVVRALYDAPYLLGIPFALTLDERGGDVLAQAFEHPPASDEHLMDVFAFLDGDEPVEVEAPAAPEGAEVIDDESGFGALGLYLTLAERIDLPAALAAVDGWGGDAMNQYRREDGTFCVRVAVVGDTALDDVELRNALQSWAAAMPAGLASVQAPGSDGRGVAFESCDPGPDTDLGVTGRSEEAVGVLAIRSFVLRGLLSGGIADAIASCIADRSALAVTPAQAREPFTTVGDDGLRDAVEDAFLDCAT